MELFVHDTAFMIAYYRAQHENVSRDPYAKLWLRPNLHEFTDEFAEKVSVHDELLHCLRNRFFHDALQKLAAQHEKLLLLNFGAGFSMYPFSLPDHVVSIDVDFEEIMSYKKAKTLEFNSNGLLPKRSIDFMSIDITSEIEQQRLVDAVAPYADYKKVILIEGVFFFLTNTQIETVLNLSKRLLSTGDSLMCVSFDTSLKQTQVFQRLKSYFTQVLKSDHNPYTVLPHAFYEQIDGFKYISKSSEMALGKKLGVIANNLAEETILNEYFYLLQRI